jgi:hypothetical protein
MNDLFIEDIEDIKTWELRGRELVNPRNFPNFGSQT